MNHVPKKLLLAYSLRFIQLNGNTITHDVGMKKQHEKQHK